MRRTSFALGVLLFYDPWLQANILMNGSFERPNLTGNVDSEQFITGSTDIPAWLVTGFTPVTLIRDTFTDGDVTFLAHSGDQSINLTGPNPGEANGVLQNVKLQIGHDYELTYWVGNQDNTVTNYAKDSTVALFINNDFITFVSNGNNAHHALNWKEFVYDFTSTTADTSIEFKNFTLPNEHYVGLDSVDLEDVTPSSNTPEPSTTALVGGALGTIVWLRLGSFRRRGVKYILRPRNFSPIQ